MTGLLSQYLATSPAAALPATLRSVSAAAATEPSTGEAVLFWVLAPIMVAGGIGLLFARKAVHAALCTALVMVGLGFIFFAQNAPFLGAVQIFVYAGAVMMLFLFVLMLVGVDSSDSLVETLKGQRAAGILLGLGMLVMGVAAVGHANYPTPAGLDLANAGGNITALGGLIFTTYVWAFEVTSALLITAALGAMVLAHRERLAPKVTQRELSEQRVRSGSYLTPLPGPGVYARHNAVDIPALLPDGTPSQLSVSRVLRVRGQLRGTEVVAGDVDQIGTAERAADYAGIVSRPAGGAAAGGAAGEGAGAPVERSQP